MTEIDPLINHAPFSLLASDSITKSKSKIRKVKIIIFVLSE
jgi:hypothetical protein